jgi:hypothetical protein
MPIIKQKKIYDPSKGDPVKQLKKELNELVDIQKVLIKQNEELSKSLNLVKKSSDGSEAKKLVKVTNQLKKSNNELTELQKRRIKIDNDLKKVLAQKISLEEKNSKVLAKGKVAIQEKNRQLNQEAILTSKLTGEYKKQSTLLNKLRTDYKNLAVAGKANTKEAKNLLGQITKLDTKLKQVDATVGQHQRSVGNYGNALKGVGRQFLGAAGITAGITGFVTVLKNATKIFKTFDKSASRLAAILGTTKDGITSLTDQARKLGSTTAYTASEVLALQTELAKLGFTQIQIEASTKGILDLAAATGQDLASSAELAGATLRIFNFDASEMSRVTDVLAKSTTISSLSMEKLAVIMPIVGKTADIAGVSIERTAALAGTLTDRGLDASMAATALRNIFLELSKKGITWNEAMQKINSSTDKNKTAMDLFGKRAAAAGVILSETANDTDRLEQSLINATGAAREMAEVMLDNLSGDMVKAQSAWEGFILSLESGEGVISKALRSVTQKFTTLFEMLRKVNEGESLYLQKLKKDSDFQAQVNKRWDEYTRQIMMATSEEEKLLFIQNKKRKLQNKIRGIQFSLNKGIENGIKISGRRSAELEFEINFYEELILKLQDYNKENKENNEQLEEGATGVDKLTGAEKKLFEQREKEYPKDLDFLDNYIKKLEQQRRAEIALSAAEIERRKKIKAELGDTPEVEGIGLDVNNEKEKFAELNKMNDAFNKKQSDKAKETADKKKKEDEEIAEARESLEQTFYDSAINFANAATDAIVENRLSRELSGLQAQEDALKDQLDKGLVTQEQYAERLAVINNRRREAEVRAEKRKALYDIAINTAVAIVKALPNFIAAGLVAAAGAVQAAFVAATPRPKFEKGGWIEGKSHKEGGVPIEAEGGEYMINKHNAQNAPMLLEAINNGMIRDKDLGLTPKQSKSLEASLLMQGSKNNSLLEQLVTGVGNLGYGLPYEGGTIEKKGSGQVIKHVQSSEIRALTEAINKLINK